MSNTKPSLGSKLKSAFEKTPTLPPTQDKEIYLVFRWWGTDELKLERSNTNIIGVYSSLKDANNALRRLSNQERMRLSKVLASHKNDTSKSGVDSCEMMEKNGNGSRYWVHMYTLKEERTEPVCEWKVLKVRSEDLKERKGVGMKSF